MEESALAAAQGCPHHRGPPPSRQPPAAPLVRAIPAAPGLPLIGNMVDLLLDPLAFFIKGYATLGPAFRVQAPTRSYVVLAGMEATRFFLREDGRSLDHGPLYQGVARELSATHYPISTTGERHRHLRRALQPAFSTDALAASAPAVSAEIGAALGEGRWGTRAVALPLMHRILGDVVLPQLGGQALGPRLKDAIRFARFSVGTGLGAYPAEFRFWPPYRLARARMRAWFRDLVAAHRASPPSGRAPDFIDRMLGATDEHGQPLSDDNIVALAQLIYSNSLLYVAPAAAFLLRDLLSHPDALARCRAELAAAWADGPPDFAALEGCTYFAAARRESMRLNPIGLAAPRVVRQPRWFDRCRLEVGEHVLIALSAAHYLPELYPEPHRFAPERHLGPSPQGRQPGAYVPLGLGAHACMGRRLVDGMLMLTVGALLHHGELALAPGAEVRRRRVNPFPEPTRHLKLELRGGRR